MIEEDRGSSTRTMANAFNNSKMPVRELPEDLKDRAKIELNEDPKRTQEDLDHIKEWLKKQRHIHARTDDQWLVSFLRGCKFSLERTKEKLDMFYTMRTMIPEFYAHRDPTADDVLAVIKEGVFLPLWNSKSSDPNMPRVIVIRNGAYDPQKISFLQLMKANMMLMDISLLEDETSIINGVHVVQDLTGITMGHMASPSILKKAMMLFQEAYPNRIKGIHFIHTPSFFETVFGMMRPFLNEKMKTRVNVHGGDLQSLYKVVPQEMLPAEYGGKGDSIQTIIDACLKKIGQYHDWFLEDEQFKTDESKRPGKPKTSDEMFGIEGSFRKLNVD